MTPATSPGALYATTMALFDRQRSGEGQEVDVAMFETMASLPLVEHANGAMFDPPVCALVAETLT
jgi:crotonobetainyl-CoA:carnitine CoA-transferase CaiB-like acyl-CoA transferase